MAVAQGAWRGYSHTAGQQRLMRGDLLPCSRTPATSSPHVQPVPRLTPPLLASPESDTQEGETAQDGTVSFITVSSATLCQSRRPTLYVTGGAVPGVSTSRWASLGTVLKPGLTGFFFFCLFKTKILYVSFLCIAPFARLERVCFEF